MHPADFPVGFRQSERIDVQLVHNEIFDAGRDCEPGCEFIGPELSFRDALAVLIINSWRRCLLYPTTSARSSSQAAGLPGSGFGMHASQLI